MNRERCAAIGKILERSVNEEILVVVDDAGNIVTVMRILPNDLREVQTIHPKRGRGGHQIIERRLTALLPREVLRLVKRLNWQAASRGNVLHVREMPLLVRRFEQGRRDAVETAERDEECEDESNFAVIAENTPSHQRRTSNGRSSKTESASVSRTGNRAPVFKSYQPILILYFPFGKLSGIVNKKSSRIFSPTSQMEVA